MSDKNKSNPKRGKQSNQSDRAEYIPLSEKRSYIPDFKNSTPPPPKPKKND